MSVNARAARLQHPHILGVYDSGDADSHLWFTMPFVEGESVRDRLNRERATGLGLHLARRVVQFHKGDVDFTSEPGRTVCRVRLPASGAGAPRADR